MLIDFIDCLKFLLANQTYYIDFIYFEVLICAGFDFLTGGGGMIFNLNVVQRIIRHCSCPNVQFEEDKPDDIFLGICLYKLKIPVIHTRRLHQVIHYLLNFCTSPNET